MCLQEEDIKISARVSMQRQYHLMQRDWQLEIKVLPRNDKVIAELKPENLPKQYFFRTKEAVNTLRFDKVKRQVVG